MVGEVAALTAPGRDGFAIKVDLTDGDTLE
jgi:hypothetical protein